ncbi:MAG: imidazole glycerol phosphate synthase subunit HisH [Actinobacteria bacterium]|nr:imidazole glycerol phosphate synthase subunit HisH [Actinomycetota bacterium]
MEDIVQDRLKKNIILIDYQVGNIGSIINMIKKIGYEAKLSDNQKEISSAEKLIFPGVGAFDEGMEKLNKSGLIPILIDKVINQKTPILGICLGMQLLTEKSEEGNLPGLGWIKGETKKFKFKEEDNLRVPHMGWNTVHPMRTNSIFRDLEDNPRFYFVHSFYVDSHDSNDVLGITNYGHDFASVIEKENIFGVQFHPEKSHRFGMKLLKNFIELQ